MTTTAPIRQSADGADVLASAWSLKQACQAAWVNDPPAALEAAERLRALSLAHPLPAVSALADWAEGIAGLARGELLPALQNLQQAATLWAGLQQALHAAEVGIAMVMPLALLGRFDEALATAQSAERELLAQGEHRGAAKIALNLGGLAMQRDRYLDAAAHYRRAAVRFARLGDREHSVMADISLATALGFAGRAAEARRIYARAASRADQHDLGLFVASAVHGLALLDLSEGRHAQALKGLVKAQRDFERFGVDHYLTEVERDLADAYMELRLLPEALALYDTLVQRLRSQGNQATLPWLLLQRSRALARARRWAEAQQTLREALQGFRSQENAAGTRAAQLALLEAEQAAGPSDATAAALRATQAGQLAPALQGSLAWRARLVQVAALRDAGQGDEALALLRPLCAAGARGELPQLAPQAWDQAGRLHLAGNRPVEAAAAFEKAIAAFEAWRAALPGQDFQLAALSGHLDPYESRLGLALSGLLTPASGAAQAAEVLVWLDRTRAGVLCERLGRALPAEGSENEPDATARARLNWIRQQDLRRIQGGEGGLPQHLLDEADSLEHGLLERARRAAAAGQGASPGGAQPLAPLDIERLAARFTGESALVEYGVVGDELLAVSLSREGLQLHRRLASNTVLQQRLRRLRLQLDTARCGAPHLHAHAAQLAQRCRSHLQALHALLWAPLAPALAGASELTVVPCDALRAVPFHALHDGTGWLDERVRLHLAASARLAAHTPAAGTPQRCLLIGEGSRLQHVQGELKAAAAELPSPSVLLNEAARVGATLTAARDADLLHLACHAEFRIDNPRFSALHLGDGLLTAEQIEAAHLPARLVVMSACDTGRGSESPGDENLGLVRAFLVAGAREVVASLWAVDDEATAGFMRAFYRAWQRNGCDTAAALQQARCELRASHPHPFHWAAFAVHRGAAM